MPRCLGKRADYSAVGQAEFKMVNRAGQRPDFGFPAIP
jgi:hypothetical protein